MDIPLNGKMVKLHAQDALGYLATLEGVEFGAVITDPPYSSGASTLSGRQQNTSKKYTSTKATCPMPDFEGDTLDQRSWTRWMCEILREVRRVSAPGAPLCIFCDWRQQGALTDAIQWAGWIWRGTVVWDKVNSRPQQGRFRQQAEFIQWASNGAMPMDRKVDVLPGVLRHTALQTVKRHHQTEKPLELMRQIVRITEPGGVIFDPFAGSGTTLLAAALEGYDSEGTEISPRIYDIAVERLQKVG